MTCVLTDYEVKKNDTAEMTTAKIKVVLGSNHEKQSSLIRIW